MVSFRPIKKGTTDVSVVIRIIDSTDGTPEQAVEHDTSGIALWYRRDGATLTAITEAALASLDAAHSDGGIEHIDDGYYRLDLPDAACASGANGVTVGGTVTDMIVIGCYVPLVDYDPYDTVRAGLTALPNAAADAAGGLPISDAGGLDIDTVASNVAEIMTDTGTTLDGKLDTIDSNVDSILEDTGTTLPGTLSTIDGIVDDILVDTGTTIPASIAALPTDADVQTAAGAALTAYDPPTRGELTTDIGTVTTAIGNLNDVSSAEVNAACDTAISDAALATAANLATVDGVVDSILEDTGTTLPATLATMDGKLDTIDDFLDTEVAAILEDTGTTIPAAIAALNDLSAADVNAEVVDALNVDTYAEPGQGAPSGTPTMRQMLHYLYKAWRNKTTSDADSLDIYNDAGDTVDQKATISDDGSVFTRSEIGTGA